MSLQNEIESVINTQTNFQDINPFTPSLHQNIFILNAFGYVQGRVESIIELQPYIESQNPILWRALPRFPSSTNFIFQSVDFFHICVWVRSYDVEEKWEHLDNAIHILNTYITTGKIVQYLKAEPAKVKKKRTFLLQKKIFFFSYSIRPTTLKERRERRTPPKKERGGNPQERER